MYPIKSFLQITRTPNRSLTYYLNLSYPDCIIIFSFCTHYLFCELYFKYIYAKINNSMFNAFSHNKGYL